MTTQGMSMLKSCPFLSPHGMIVTFRWCRIPVLNLKPYAGGLYFLLETPTKANHC